MEIKSTEKVAGGTLKRVEHASESTKTKMVFSIFIPGSALGAPSKTGWPVIYWLSGLTCDDTNFSQKSGAFQYAANQGVAIVVPDTSPRGTEVPNDEAYDFGQGAGFYVNATQAPFSKKL
mmetsp:Transcript_11157/g.13947  ORF Transcript_11157/g.13947 Transcript_11157/m.13947 type:complete len:120 (+) Transcript_11157:23-382(+)